MLQVHASFCSVSNKLVIPYPSFTRFYVAWPAIAGQPREKRASCALHGSPPLVHVAQHCPGRGLLL